PLRHTHGLGRRSLLAGVAAGTAGTALLRRAALARAASFEGSFGIGPWAQAAAIRQELATRVIARPELRWLGVRSFYVTAYGAQPCQLAPTEVYVPPGTALTQGVAPASGSFDNYAAFAAAIAACNAAGGGQVIVPAGNWYCVGPITL